jgi:hypothetical protein
MQLPRPKTIENNSDVADSMSPPSGVSVIVTWCARRANFRRAQRTARPRPPAFQPPPAASKTALWHVGGALAHVIELAPAHSVKLLK